MVRRVCGSHAQAGAFPGGAWHGLRTVSSEPEPGKRSAESQKEEMKQSYRAGRSVSSVVTHEMAVGREEKVGSG